MQMEWRLTEELDFHGRAVRYGVKGEGPPLVCVHGTPWSSFNLRHLIDGLSKHYTVHFHDLLGYGQSSKAPGDVSLGIQNRVLTALLDHWGLQEPVLVAHDFGGATGLRTHLLDRRRFQRLVLIDPVAVAPWGSPFFRHVNRHEEAFAGVPGYIHEAIVRAYVQTAAYEPLDESLLDRIIAPWTGEAGQAAFYRQIAQADQRYTDEIQPLYSSITAPTLILWGREDNWIPLERGEELQRLIPEAGLEVVDDAGHLVIEERPEDLLSRIMAFIDQPENGS